MNIHRLGLFSIISVLPLLAGCASDEAVKSTEAELQYEAAKKKISKGEYDAATFDLEKFSTDFPYSSYATKGELLRIFSAYKGKEYVLSETLSEGFVERHPKHGSVDYAKYILAMSYYMQKGDPENDQTYNRLAIEGFKRLLKEHPGSKYAKDGKARLQKLYNSIAKHELIVGKFYFDRNQHVAAANRFQKVVKEHQTTDSIEEALYYLTATYIEMELSKDARQTALLLRHNYPNSEWSSKARALFR